MKTESRPLSTKLKAGREGIRPTDTAAWSLKKSTRLSVCLDSSFTPLNCDFLRHTVHSPGPAHMLTNPCHVIVQLCRSLGGGDGESFLIRALCIQSPADQLRPAGDTPR